MRWRGCITGALTSVSTLSVACPDALAAPLCTVSHGRGYAGELAPAAALDLLVNDSSAVLVDVRTPKEKEASGIPDLPSGASARVGGCRLLTGLCLSCVAGERGAMGFVKFTGACRLRGGYLEDTRPVCWN